VSGAYDNPVYLVRMTVQAADADDLAEALAAQWGQAPAQMQRPGSTTACLDLYFPDEVQARLALAAVTAGEPRVRAATVHRTDPAQWEAAFRRQFPIREIGARLRIVPVWERDAAPADHRINLYIDPGLSFGTGTHFTTAFCLEMMDGLWQASPPSSFLDVGTGSGLLAIAAARLGCGRVAALEADEDVLPYARRNFALNGVDEAIALRRATVGVDAVTESGELVCANLVGATLLACASELTRAADRVLVMSGIREAEADAVAGVYGEAGWREQCRDGDGEWTGLMMER
jgi:ribosomal protein L11 methyltransferase